MELNREPDPKPAPPVATGAVIEKKKMQVITAAAILFGLVMAMLLGWLVMRHKQPVVAQGPMPSRTPTGALPSKPTPKIDEAAEEAYEKDRRDGTRFNPAFNVGNSGSGTSGSQSRVETVATTPKRTPKDDYEDLLQKAALADSTVTGERHERNSAVPRNTDLGEARRPLGLPGNDNPDLGKSGASRDSNAHRNRLEALSQRTLPAGTFIYCALVNELNGENVGPVKVQVSNDVYFPGTFDIAIPQGSIFLGEAQRVSAQFQQRLAVTFDRLQITRDGKMYEIALDKIPGLDQQGATALKDRVDFHYVQIFGASLAIGAIGGLAQIGNGGSYGGYGGIDTETQIRNGISQMMAQNASQILNRFLNRLPSVVIRSGTPVVVYIPFGAEL